MKEKIKMLDRRRRESAMEIDKPTVFNFSGSTGENHVMLECGCICL